VTNRGTRMHVLHLPVSVRGLSKKVDEVTWSLGFPICARSWDHRIVNIQAWLYPKPASQFPSIYRQSLHQMCCNDQEDMQSCVFFPAATTQCRCTLSTRLQRKKNPTKQQKRPAASLRIVNIQVWLWNSPQLDFLSLTHKQEDMQAWFFPQLLQHNADVHLWDCRERIKHKQTNKTKLHKKTVKVKSLCWGSTKNPKQAQKECKWSLPYELHPQSTRNFTKNIDTDDCWHVRKWEKRRWYLVKEEPEEKSL